MEHTYIQSKIRTPVIVLMVAVGLLIAVLMTDSIIDDIHGYYHNILVYVLAAVLAGIGVWAVISLLRLRKYTIYDDRIEVHTITGSHVKSIYRVDLRGWQEAEYRHQNTASKSRHFTLFVGEYKLRFSTIAYKNYEEITAALKTWAPEINNVSAKLRQHYGAAMALGIAGAVFVVLLLYVVSNPAKIEAPKLEAITGSVAEQPELKKPSKGSPYMTIILKEYPGFEFKLSGDAAKAANTDALTADVATGDHLTMEVETDEYEQLLNPKPRGSYVWKPYVNIDVFSVRDSRQQYVSFDDYANDYYNEQGPFWKIMVLSIFALSLLILAYHNLQKAKKLERGG